MRNDHLPRHTRSPRPRARHAMAVGLAAVLSGPPALAPAAAIAPVVHDAASSTLGLSAPSSLTGARFRDVPLGHPFFEEVEWLAARGTTTGFGDGSFGATAPVSRQAMAAFLYRDAAVTSFEPEATARFPDVPTHHPFYREVSWLAGSGITRGLEDGTFGAGEPVTRSAMAAFLFRYSAPKDYAAPSTPRFTDVPVDHPFFREISWLAETGITTGLRDGSFGANQPITREAMAAFLYRRANPGSTTPVPAPTPAPPTAGSLPPAPTPAPSPTTPPSGVGVPAGTALRVHQGDLIITTPGAVIDGLDVRGFVDVRAAGVVIRNSVVRGRDISTHRGLVTVSSPSYSVTIEDSELAMSTPSPNVDGLRGMNITARRLNIHSVIDQAHIYGDNVLIENSRLHSNAHFADDPNWSGGSSHDDNIQIQVGSNITIRNNSLTGSHSASIMVTQGRGQVRDLRIENNFLDHGACIINFADVATVPSGVRIWDNRFGRNATWSFCALKVPNRSYVLDLQRNVFTDGGAVSITR